MDGLTQKILINLGGESLYINLISFLAEEIK